METNKLANGPKRWPLVISLLIVLTSAAVFSWLFFREQAIAPDGSSVSSFEECMEAGHPVMESYPRQCRAGNQTFTEDMADSEAHENR